MMEYATERKVVHREWDEVTIEADEFFDNLHHIMSAAVQLGLTDPDGEIDDVIQCPTLTYSNGEIHVDEMWSVKGRGRVSTSSHPSGVSDWDDAKGAHVQHVHFQEHILGEFVSISFSLNEEMQGVLDAVRGED